MFTVSPRSIAEYSAGCFLAKIGTLRQIQIDKFLFLECEFNIQMWKPVASLESTNRDKEVSNERHENIQET